MFYILRTGALLVNFIELGATLVLFQDLISNVIHLGVFIHQFKIRTSTNFFLSSYIFLTDQHYFQRTTN